MPRTPIGNGFLLLRANWALAVRGSLLLALAYLCFVPVVKGVANLDAARSAECLEQFIAIAGVFLLVPLTRPEHSREVREVVLCKKKPYLAVLLLRLVMALLLLLVLIAAFAVGAVARSVIAGYCASAGYLLLNILGGIPAGSGLYLFSMADGNFGPKYWLLALGGLCFLATGVVEASRRL